MCIWFGYNPCLNFCHFFHFANFVIPWPQILWKCIDSGYLVSPSPHTILYQSFWNFAHFAHSLYNFMPIFIQLCTSFVHGLKMCMWFGFNPAVYFCHFSIFLTLSFFTGATSTSLKFDLYFPNPLMDLVYIWYDDRYWSKILFSTIPTPMHDLKVKVMDLELLC